MTSANCKVFHFEKCTKAIFKLRSNSCSEGSSKWAFCRKRERRRLREGTFVFAGERPNVERGRRRSWESEAETCSLVASLLPCFLASLLACLVYIHSLTRPRLLFLLFLLLLLLLLLPPYSPPPLAPQPPPTLSWHVLLRRQSVMLLPHHTMPQYSPLWL